jgi:hypothetical protein
MKGIGPGLLLIILLGGCFSAASVDSPSPARPDPSARDTEATDSPLERLVDAYLTCTAEAAVDAVLDGATLVQSQLALADLCSARKIELLTMVEDADRADMARRLKDWDLSTLGAIRERLQDLEASLKIFMDCSYENVRTALSQDYDHADGRFLENLVTQEISRCYDGSLGNLLHPRMSAQSPVGIARKDRVMLIAKERVMQEIYEEIRRQREGEVPSEPPARDGKNDVVAMRRNV